MILPSLLALGLAVGSMYALFAVSFGLIFRVTHIFHFAHGAVICAGGYTLFVLIVRLGWPIWAGIIGAIFVAALLGAGIERAIYRPLRRMGAPHLALFLTSVGVLVVMQGFLGAVFGPGVAVFSFLPLASVTLGPISLTTANIAMFGAWPLIALVVLWLRYARLGRFMRAVSDTPAVAVNVGIDLDRTYLVAFLLGSALTVPAVLMYAWYQGITPMSGLDTVLISSAAVIIGGSAGSPAAAVAALGLGVVQAVGILLLPSGWQEAVMFAILLLVIVLRPQGVFSRPVRA
jgi:branched-chain amino acid transport system permease protein